MTERYYQDNIVAIATAEQNGAIGILRISGKDAKKVLEAVFVKDSEKNVDMKPWHMHYGKLVSKESAPIDHCLAVYMPGPKNYTGEDIVEIHCHGNLILLKKAVKEILLLNGEFEIRGAEAGEFTKRAYLNGRIDLTQAESVHELITANSEAALQASLSNMDGALRRIVEGIRDKLTRTLADIEASFEFPEEDIQTYDKSKTFQLVDNVQKKLCELKEAYKTSKLYDNGVSVAIVGEPNVGKSSFLNAILVEDRAIVTDVPGTTRDVVEGSKIISGVRFFFKDTAGLRDSEDQIETTGIGKTSEWIQKADIIIHVCDKIQGRESLKTLSDIKIQKKTLCVLNKADILSFNNEKLDKLSSDILNNIRKEHSFHTIFSAKTGFGLGEIEALLKAYVEKNTNKDNRLHVNERQVIQINSSLDLLSKIGIKLGESNSCEEIVADNLRSVIKHLEEMIGMVTSDDVLTDIFKRFCIGK